MLKVKTTHINAEGQNNAYEIMKDMLKVRNTSKTSLALVRCKTKGQC